MKKDAQFGAFRQQGAQAVFDLYFGWSRLDTFGVFIGKFHEKIFLKIVWLGENGLSRKKG